MVWVLLRDQRRERGERKGYRLTKECLNGRRSVSDDEREYGLPFAKAVGGCEGSILMFCFVFSGTELFQALISSSCFWGDPA